MLRRTPHRSGPTSGSGPTNLSASRSLRFLPGIQAIERGFEIAFGVDQEVRGDHHLVVFSKTLLDLDMATAAATELDRAWLETPFAFVEKHNLPLAAVDDRTARYSQDRCFRPGGDFYIGIHVGAQHIVRVRQLDSYSCSTRLRFQMRIDHRDLPGERTIRIGARTHRDLLPNSNERKITFGDVDHQP